MSNKSEIQLALDSIQDFVDGFDVLHKESKEFFTMWTLVNNLYNAKGYQGKESRRAVELGNEYKNVFAFVDKNAIIKLVIPECVGNGKSDKKPSKEVKPATFALRATLNLSKSCKNCRSSKQIGCATTQPEGWQDSDLGALMRILYQVRCNLIHGDKVKANNAIQLQRDEDLIYASKEILFEILKTIK